MRRVLGAWRRAPQRLGRRCAVAGQRLVVPAGVPHPLADAGPAFYYRTVGPMIAPEHRVLVLDCGAGLGALLAASRGAQVLAVDADAAAREATRANAVAAGLADRVTVAAEVGDVESPFDLVFDVRGSAPASDLRAWLGDQGRLLPLVRLAEPRPEPPPGHRAVRLATSPGVLAPFEVLSVGWDLEAARAARHEALGSDDGRRRAAVSRRRWEGADGPPPDGVVAP